MVLWDVSERRILTIGYKANVFVVASAAGPASPISTTPIGTECVEIGSTILLKDIHCAIGQGLLDPCYHHNAVMLNALAENLIILARHEQSSQATKQVRLTRNTLLCFSTPSGAVDFHL